MSVRVRLAPSPTGFMHIGNLRTALWDYFLARQSGGKFVIRIEDTDQTRLVPGAVEKLLATLQRTSITHDEGPMLKADNTIEEVGECGPYVQSARLHLYRPYAEQLLKAGHAYYCFCSKERLEEMRAAQIAVKQTPKYDRRCLSLDASQVAQRIGAGESHVVRLKIPDGRSTFVDAIRGEVSFNNNDVDDQVLVKADGFPTYHLAVVVDDHLMKISHVLRGEEWLSSTPKQIILHQMLGWDMPIYAHVPLLLNPDKTKLSKRQGDVTVESYLDHGYLPDALINFIATLGFNPKPDQEIYTREELIQLFDLSRVNKSGAVLNHEKLDWMNKHYIAQLTADAYVAYAQKFTTTDLTTERAKKAALVERERIAHFDEIDAKIVPYLADVSYEPSILVWKKSTAEEAKTCLESIKGLVASLDDATFADIKLLETAVKAYITGQGLQNGSVLWPLRVALSGAEKSASPFELLWVLGPQESVARIAGAIAKL